MSSDQPNASREPFYRIDKFAVPAAGRNEFLGKVAATHALLRRQEGFVRDLIMEQQSGPGIFNVVTLVEWTGPEAVERVSAAVAELHKKMGFDRHEMMARLGVRADIANYRRLDL
ncbi:MAG TPA: antibiotic biosynthesis monooxygenase [Pseudolabrys sp.]|jgi:hypothetical protein|nr:antibiotic biosynthesis monooxygenase [Pseudolabrys sp.]